MALGFPTNPYIGETYAFGTKVYIWNGHGWAISNTQGTTTVGNLTATNSLVVSSGTNSTSTVTGSVVVGGGIGVGGNVNVGGSINAGSNSTVGGAQIITTATLNNYVLQPVFVAGTDTAITTSTTGGTETVTIWNTSTLQTVTDRGATTNHLIQFTNTTNSTSTTTGAVVIAGGVGIGGDVNVGGQLSAERVKITDAIIDSTLVLVNTTATTVIDSYPFGSYRSAKYLVQIEETGGAPSAKFQTIEILLLVDNGGTVYATEYGQLSTAGALGDFSAGLDGADNMIKLYFTPYQTTNKEVVVLRTALVL